MTQTEIRNRIQEIRTKADGTFFSVHFIKKNGELRKMVARLNVTKDLKGVGKAYNDDDYGILTVRDVQKQAYRSIKVDKITFLQIKGAQLV